VLSSWIYKRNDRMETFGSGILIPLFIAGVLSTLILFEPDYSTAALIIAITLFMVFLGGAKLVHLASIILPVIVSGVGALLLKPYRIKRLIEFYSTDLEMSTGFTQIKQSIIALGRGGFIGKGIGNSLQKLRFLADCHTDFIYSIIGEEGGFLGAILVLLLFMVVLYRGYRIALRCPHLFGSLLAAGMTTSIGLNAFVHIMVTLKLVPTTGLTLPFISAGGTSLIITLVMVGIVLNVSRYTELERTKYIPGRMT